MEETIHASWTLQEDSKEISIEKVRVICRLVDGTDSIPYEQISITVTSVTSNQRDFIMEWNIHTTSPSSMMYSTCIESLCTSMVSMNTTPAIQPLHIDDYTPIHISIQVHVNTTIECEGYTTITQFDNTRRNDHIVEYVLLGCAMIFILLVGHFLWLRRRRREKPAQESIIELPPLLLSPPQEPTWFETIYHNDAALPSSILHDDQCTRAILQSSVPSDHSLSLHSVLFEIESSHIPSCDKTTWSQSYTSSTNEGYQQSDD